MKLLDLPYGIKDQTYGIIALLNHTLWSVCYSFAQKIIPWALQELSLRYIRTCFHYDFPPVIITFRKCFSPSDIAVPTPIIWTALFSVLDIGNYCVQLGARRTVRGRIIFIRQTRMRRQKREHKRRKKQSEKETTNIPGSQKSSTWKDEERSLPRMPVPDRLQLLWQISDRNWTGV